MVFEDPPSIRLLTVLGRQLDAAAAADVAATCSMHDETLQYADQDSYARPGIWQYNKRDGLAAGKGGFAVAGGLSLQVTFDAVVQCGVLNLPFRLPLPSRTIALQNTILS